MRNKKLNEQDEGYNHNLESVDKSDLYSFHVINSANSGISTRTIGTKSDSDLEFEARLRKANSMLTPKEHLVMTLVGKGKSLSEVGRRLGISQQAVSKTWLSIRTKLKGV